MGKENSVGAKYLIKLDNYIAEIMKNSDQKEYLKKYYDELIKDGYPLEEAFIISLIMIKEIKEKIYK